MILLRCISFAIGSLILAGAPFVLLPDAPQRPIDGAQVLSACALIALMSSGFLLVGVAGNHMKRSRRTRMLGALLLAIPILGSIGVLMLDHLPEETWMVAPLMCCATFMFFIFVYPAKRSPLHRRLRPRDPGAIITEA